MADLNLAKLQKLSQEEVRKMASENSQIRGYEFVFPKMPPDFKKLCVAEVREMIRQIRRIGNRESCLQVARIKYFAEVSHPKIFAMLFEKDAKKKKKMMAKLELMLLVMDRIEKNPHEKQALLQRLGANMLGIDRNAKKTA